METVSKLEGTKLMLLLFLYSLIIITVYWLNQFSAHRSLYLITIYWHKIYFVQWLLLTCYWTLPLSNICLYYFLGKLWVAMGILPAILCLKFMYVDGYHSLTSTCQLPGCHN